MDWSKAIVIGLALAVLASAVVLAQTGKSSEGWVEAMKEHYKAMHGTDDFEEHHKAVHGENWKEAVQSCHAASGDARTTSGYGMMGAWI